MASPLFVLEGTWEEIAAHAGEFAGHRVRLTVLTDPLDAAPAEAPKALERDPERVTRVKGVRGRFAQADGGLASEALHAERQADKTREEREIREHSA